MTTRALALGLACGLSACTAPSDFKPYVTPLSPESAAVAAYDITAFVTERVPAVAGSSIVVLQPPDDTTLWPLVSEDLRAFGYTVTEGQARHHLRFAVSTLPEGTFLRASLDGASMAQLYHYPDAGAQIEPSGPATILTDEAAE